MLPPIHCWLQDIEKNLRLAIAETLPTRLTYITAADLAKLEISKASYLP